MALTIFEEFKNVSTSSLDEIKKLVVDHNFEKNQFISFDSLSKIDKKEHRNNMRELNIKRKNRTVTPNVTPVTPKTPKTPPATPAKGTGPKTPANPVTPKVANRVP
jgi:hypothetical protein